MFTKKTVKDIDLQGKRVLMRAEYDVPLDDGGRISNDYRIKTSLPTIQYLLEQGCSIVIMAHLGRPEGVADPKLSLAPVATRLGELLGREVQFVHDCIGSEVSQATEKIQPGQIILLENTRFHPEEEKNDSAFAEKLKNDSHAEIFAQECFGVAHRAHASVEAIAHLLPSVAGFLLEQEVDTITRVMQSPERPLMSVIGGAKVSDKIEILKRLVDISDCVVVVGAMANTFLMATGIAVGKSLVEKDAVDTAHSILEKVEQKQSQTPFTFLLPQDLIVSANVDGSVPTRIVDLSSQTYADVEAYPKLPSPESHIVGSEEAIFDIGPTFANRIAGLAMMAKTVIWNGTAGVTETKGINSAADPFAHGTETILESLQGVRNALKPFTLVGGGDTVGYVMSHAEIDPDSGKPTRLNHVSTGGGASLELMAGHTLPGVEALLDK